MNSYKWALSIVLLGALILSACQPVMPEVASETVAPSVPEPTETEPVVTGPITVLCLGDDEIEENWGVCNHLAGMAAAADPPVVIVADHIVKEWIGLQTGLETIGVLKDFWEMDEVRDRISAGEWDWVVLYENLLDELNILEQNLAAVNAIPLEENPKDYAEIENAYVEFGRNFATEIEQSGGNAVFLVSWPCPMQIESDRSPSPSPDDLVSASMLALADSNARLAPVGPAWNRSNEIHPEMDLNAVFDSFSPTIKGTYLSAAVLYATILGRNPIGLDYQPTDILPDSGPAAFFKDKWQMTDEEIAILQQIAWETVQEIETQQSASQ